MAAGTEFEDQMNETWSEFTAWESRGIISPK